MKRGIAGSLVFVVLDRDALIEAMGKTESGYAIVRPAIDPTYVTKDPWSTGVDATLKPTSELRHIREWGKAMSGRLLQKDATVKSIFGIQSASTTSEGALIASKEGGLFAPRMIRYADEIPPFHITITMANEYGRAAYMRVLYVEILNEGMGFSIDDIVTERACTFVARDIEYLRPVTYQGKSIEV